MPLAGLFRQSVHSRLAGCEYVNDADQVSTALNGAREQEMVGMAEGWLAVLATYAFVAFLVTCGVVGAKLFYG